jgi:hypothetical protein
MEFRDRMSNRSNEIWEYNEGVTEEEEKEKDLISLIVVSLSIALSHVANAYEKKIYVKNRVEMKECVKMMDISIKTRFPPISVEISSSVERISGNDGELNGMFVCVDFIEI